MPVTVTWVTIKPKPTKKDQSSSLLVKMGGKLKLNLDANEPINQYYEFKAIRQHHRISEMLISSNQLLEYCYWR